MKRRATACRIIQALFLVAIALLLSVTVWAQETTLTTVVPSSHTLHIELTGEGTIFVDGVAYTKAVDIQVQRQHRPVISISAAEGSKTQTVFWDEEDITAALQNEKWIAPEIAKDVILTVSFEKVGNIPQTGDVFYAELWITLFALPIVLLMVFMLQRRKRCE